MKELYGMILKRKSMRKFDKTLSLTAEELTAVKRKTEELLPLVDGIKVRFELVERAATTAKWGEYCLLLYSETRPHYLLNAGYLLEQMDLFLAALSIGACWYGMAKPKEGGPAGLDFVILLAFGKSRPQDFRSEPADFKRRSREEIWQGDFDHRVMDAVRLAPSACNTQPWRVVSGASWIKVYRSTGNRSFIPAARLPYYNSIDLGIFLCFLKIVLAKKDYRFKRTLISQEGSGGEPLEIADYSIQ